MNILLTGAAGFIGSHVADRLVRDGHNVFAVDNFSDYYSPAFKESNVAHNLERPNYHLFRLDITDRAALAGVFQANHIDSVIHLAAQAGVRMSINYPLLCERVNVGGTYTVFDVAHEFGVRDVVFASSSSVYGNQAKIPFAESDPVDAPISPYAASKRAGELIAATYHHLYGMNCIGLRFFTVYGERGRPDMSPYVFTDALLHGQPLRRFGDGSMQRDFTYIDDIVSGVTACLGKTLGYEIINLGNSHPVTLNEFIGTLEQVCGKQAVIAETPAPPEDVQKTYADVTKAKRLLDWQPTTSLQVGLQKFVRWFESNRL